MSLLNNQLVQIMLLALLFLFIQLTLVVLSLRFGFFVWLYKRIRAFRERYFKRST